ncbi:MAG: LysR family transcriptional regulator [Deltaproteobacteria bacterium]|nr:LysR family transcriptional regulator [Deltaproteobacteria bacterium]
MEIRRLEVFSKVVEMQSFTKAAEACGFSQPTVSEHIRLLEETFGGRLLERHGRRVFPTAVGKILYQYARRLIQLEQDTFQAVQQFKGDMSGTLMIGASNIPGTYLIPPLIGSFKAKHPAIKLIMKISDSNDIFKKLIENYVEIAILGADFPEDNRLELTEVFTDRLLLVVHPEHRLAKRPSVRLEEIVGEPFIFRDKGSGTRNVMTQILEKMGYDPLSLDVVAEFGNMEAIRQGIKAGIGVSILSTLAVEEDIRQGSIVGVPVSDAPFHRPFFLTRRRHHILSPIAEEFQKHLLTEFEGLKRKPLPTRPETPSDPYLFSRP